MPERLISRYPEEIKVFTRCAELQGDHWTTMGTDTKELGPESHNVIVNEILPQLDDVDLNYNQCDIESIPEASRKFYLNLYEEFPFGNLRIADKDGVRYWHRDYDDARYLAPYARSDRPNYPERHSPKFRAGKQLNKILRHYIGRDKCRENGNTEIRRNEGAWVLLEDLLRIDFIWTDKRYYRWEEKNDYDAFLVTRKSRIGLIVESTVAQTFSLLPDGLKASWVVNPLTLWKIQGD